MYGGRVREPDLRGYRHGRRIEDRQSYDYGYEHYILCYLLFLCLCLLGFTGLAAGSSRYQYSSEKQL